MFAIGLNVFYFITKGVAAEVKSKGVHVEHVNTLFVSTSMSKIRKTSFLVPSPEHFVSSVLKYCGNSYDSTLYTSHWLATLALNLFPKAIVVSMISSMHVDIRRRALKKQEREKH